MLTGKTYSRRSSVDISRVGWGGGGGCGGGGNLRPAFQNLPHSYIWPLKKMDPFIYLII